MASLVGNYLDISRIERGSTEYHFSACDIKELVMDTLAENETLIESSGSTVNFSPNKGSYLVSADADKLKEVISNLIGNAAKYATQSKIDIKLKKDRVNKKVLLSINDTGVGISREDLPYIFDKFKRTPTAESVDKTGTGLGLYIAKTIIDAHQGRIWAESKGLNKGSTFYIDLNLA